MADNRLCYGTINYGESTIDLAKDIKREHRRQTLWHEILHGILHNAGIDEHDEQMITVLASGVITVIRENPWLVKL